MDSPVLKTTSHVVIATLSIGMLLLTEANPRVLLYAHLLVLPMTMTTAWYIVAKRQLNRVALFESASRQPGLHDRGKPYRNEKTREKASLAGYYGIIATVMFMLGIVLLLGRGADFLAADVLIPELAFATGIAVLFWIDDLATKQIIIDPKKDMGTNLGYNTPALNFMLAAIFLGGLAVLAASFVQVLISDNPELLTWLDWFIFISLTVLKLIFQINRDIRSESGGFAALSKR